MGDAPRGKMKTLDEIVPAKAPQGAGVFCRLEDGRYLFALYDASQVEDGEGLILGRIGGQRQAGESWEDCVRREVQEETGCQAAVESSARCFFADAEGRVEEIAVEAEPRPVLISRQPAAGAVVPGGIYYNLLFWARVLGEPRPGPEIDALVLLDEALLREMAHSAPTLRELTEKGAQVILARALEAEAPVRLGRSPRVLLDLLNRIAPR